MNNSRNTRATRYSAGTQQKTISINQSFISYIINTPEKFHTDCVSERACGIEIHKTVLYLVPYVYDRLNSIECGAASRRG